MAREQSQSRIQQAKEWYRLLEDIVHVCALAVFWIPFFLLLQAFEKLGTRNGSEVTSDE